MSDDERIERARQFQARLGQELDRHRITEMEAQLAAVPEAGPGGIPLPSSCHPYYAKDRATILAWLDGTLGYGSHHQLTIPRMPVVRAADFFNPPEPQATLKTDELERHKFRAPAPYVGEPYELWWSAGIDRRGRAVAGEVRYEFLSQRGGSNP